MADLEKTKKALEARGFSVRIFPDAKAAADCLNRAVDSTTVGFGGSMTLDELGLFDMLSAHNTVHWHWKQGGEARQPAAEAEVYFTSANGIAETGEILNIDGAGNRVASMLYGHRRLYIVAGRNKVAPTYDEALWRARNIAAPKNAQRLKTATPCAVKGDRCYDCKSPQRICRGLAVLWAPMMGVETEVILIDEDLGY
jgi:L-lactate utilization protein LutB